jgi:hypothetical protein
VSGRAPWSLSPVGSELKKIWRDKRFEAAWPLYKLILNGELERVSIQRLKLFGSSQVRDKWTTCQINQVKCETSEPLVKEKIRKNFPAFKFSTSVATTVHNIAKPFFSVVEWTFCWSKLVRFTILDNSTRVLSFEPTQVQHLKCSTRLGNLVA